MQDKKDDKNKGRQIRIKAKDEVLGGAYANTMIVAHTKEEFVLDFLAVFPPQGQLTSRVIISPGHSRVEMRCAQPLGGEFPTGALSIAPRVPNSTIAHVSASPPLIPDSRIS
ncbi:MAG: DUF3467 domain-containing protein, partial [Pseudomonadota bacterium]